MIAPFVIAGAAILGAVAAIQEGQAAKEAAEANAYLERQRGEAIKKRGAFELAKNKRAGRALKSSQLAAAGAGGGDLAGSPLDIIADSAAKTELDAMAIRYNTAFGVRQAEGRAEIQSFTGTQAERASFFKAGTTLLAGAGAIAGLPPAPGGGLAPTGATNPVATSGVHP